MVDRSVGTTMGSRRVARSRCCRPQGCPHACRDRYYFRSSGTPGGGPDPGSQTGSQHRQTLSDARRFLAIIAAAKRRMRRHQATSRDPSTVPSKQRVAGSNPAGRAGARGRQPAAERPDARIRAAGRRLRQGRRVRVRRAPAHSGRLPGTMGRGGSALTPSTRGRRVPRPGATAARDRSLGCSAPERGQGERGGQEAAGYQRVFPPPAAPPALSGRRDYGVPCRAVSGRAARRSAPPCSWTTGP